MFYLLLGGSVVPGLDILLTYYWSSHISKCAFWSFVYVIGSDAHLFIYFFADRNPLLTELIISTDTATHKEIDYFYACFTKYQWY
jgi:hypothetical protein